MYKIQFSKYFLKGSKNILSTTTHNIWFTSDTHFGHKNIIDYCHRPYNDVNEMNEDLICRWNSVVGVNDIVFHLGDVQLGGGNKLMDNIFPRLNGHIILITGNHDCKNLKPRHIDLIDDCFEQLTVVIDGIKCILTHCPYSLPGKDMYNEFNLHGHLHSRENVPLEDCSVQLYPNHYDVGVDNNNYCPVSFNEIKHKIYNRLSCMEEMTND